MSLSEVESRTHTYGRFANIEDPNQLRTSLAARNTWQGTWGSDFSSPPGLFFDYDEAKTYQELELEARHKRKTWLSQWELEFVDLGRGVGRDVYFDRISIESYLKKTPYAVRILMHITPDNYYMFNGLMHLSTNAGIRERIFTPVRSYDDIKPSVATFSLERLSPEQLIGLGDNVKLAIYSQDTRKPAYVSYSQFSSSAPGHSNS